MSLGDYDLLGEEVYGQSHGLAAPPGIILSSGYKHHSNPHMDSEINFKELNLGCMFLS